jgi:glutamyl-Q tRNA(Asp) synthetase
MSTSTRPLGGRIVVRKEAPTSYHLSVVVDDALQGVTHVVRGRDLEAATALHVLLQRLLGLPSPTTTHHDLIRDEAGQKLAKSLASEPLAALRAAGPPRTGSAKSLGFPPQPTPST